MYSDQSIKRTIATFLPPGHIALFALIRGTYNDNTLKMCRQIINRAKRLATFGQQLMFNYRCKHYSLTPFYLRTRPLVHSSEGKKLTEKFSSQSLNAHIALNHHSIARLHHEREHLHGQLAPLIARDTMDALTTLENQAYDMTT